MGAGLPMAPGDIAFKSNFATYNHETGIVEKRRADRQFEHLGPELCAALDGEGFRILVLAKHLGRREDHRAQVCAGLNLQRLVHYAHSTVSLSGRQSVTFSLGSMHR